MAALAEPTQDEVAYMAGIPDALEWAGIHGHPRHTGTIAGSLLHLIGIVYRSQARPPILVHRVISLK